MTGIMTTGTTVDASSAYPNDRRAAGPAARAERDAFAQIIERVRHFDPSDVEDHSYNWLRPVIWERALACGATTSIAYQTLLDDPAEMQQLHHAIKDRDTRFFRAPALFTRLKDELLPALWSRRGTDQPLRLWCAGCASGEEAYTLAITVRESAARARIPADRPAIILASDIRVTAISAAEEGIYDNRALINVYAHIRDRYFGAMGKDWQVTDELRGLVGFQMWSLLDDVWPVLRGSIDVIVCHDVLPFAPEEVRAGIVERFHDVLAPGGYLLVSEAESPSVPAGLKPAGPGIHQKEG